MSEFWALLGIGMLIPVLPLFVKGPLDTGSIGVGIAVAASTPTALLVQPIGGRLGDRIGRRPLLIAGGLGLALGFALMAPASSLPVLVAVRLLIGAGEALVFVAAATIINDLAPPHRRGEAVSLYSLATWGALAAGPPVGELVLAGDHYDRVWLAAAAAALVSAATALLVAETKPTGSTPPTGPFRLLHRAALLPGLVLVASMIGFAGMAAFAPLYARELGLAGAGSLFALNAVIVVTVRLVGRRIPDVFGPRRTATAAVVLSASGLAVIALWRDPVGLYAGTVVLACGQSLVFPALMLLVVGSAPEAERSAAVGSFTAFADLGFAVGAIALGAVASATGYASVFAVAAGFVALGLLPLARTRPVPRVSPPVATDAPP